MKNGNTPSLFGDGGVKVNASMQGDLGDSWLLAAATALAETPNRVTKLFMNRNYTP